MIKNTYLFFTILFIFFNAPSLPAQDFESFRRQQQEAFQSYKQKTQDEWEAYRRKVNADFAEFLAQPWVKKDGEKPTAEPKEIPDVPPIVMPDIDVEIPEDNLIDIEINFPKLEDTPAPVAPVPYRPKPSEKTLSFMYYGTPGSVRFDINKRAVLKGTDEKAVSRFWKELSGEAYDNVVADCLTIRNERDLCDWAYFKMTEKVAETMYSTHNDCAVFHAWLLAQSGFSVRLGRDNGSLYLLLGTTSILFGKSYWELSGGYFFLLDDVEPTSMYVVDVGFPNTSPMRMRMNARNDFAKSIAPARKLESKKYSGVKATVSCDNNVLAFLRDVPMSAIEGKYVTDYLKYADMPISSGATQSLYSVLKSQIKDKTESEAANILLNFVQTAFEYSTDKEVWGTERTFFPEETLFYPYSDCEDRAILFTRLVKDLMGLDVAFVLYPGHLATAVHFSQDYTGDYFLVNGTRYLICDPTFINAPIGCTMTGMDNTTAQVFLF